MMPPSPRLSARIIKTTYLSVTTTMSAHAISESTPTTLSCTTGKLWPPPKDSFIAYSGLVPMSPYTTPIAPMASPSTPCSAWVAGRSVAAGVGACAAGVAKVCAGSTREGLRCGAA